MDLWLHNNVFRNIAGSNPNIRKNGPSLDYSFGKKLYAAQANGITWFHSRVLDTYLDMHAFKKWWNPSILPLIVCGKEVYILFTELPIVWLHFQTELLKPIQLSDQM